MFYKNYGKEIIAEDIKEIPEKKVENNRARVGYSHMINDSRIIDALKKQKKGTTIFGVILVLAPIVVTLVMGIVNSNFEYLPIGIILSVIFLVINLVSVISHKTKKQWDGEVIRKYTKEVTRRDSADNECYQTYTQYIVEIKDDNGKKRKIVGSSTEHNYYEYLNEGDRIRFYPQFTNFYEKYDKTHDTKVNCPICGSFNLLTEDVCPKCGVPIIK